MNTTDYNQNMKPGVCRCECGGRTASPGTRYLPGHDARHVSRLLEEYKDQARKLDGDALVDYVLNAEHALTTDALVEKYRRAVMRWTYHEFERLMARKLLAGRTDDTGFGWRPDAVLSKLSEPSRVPTGGNHAA